MLNIYQTKEEASRAAAQHFVERAKLAIEAKAKFTVALTGGSSPAGMYDLLTTEFKDQVDWDKIFNFWGDERWVPIEDDRSNAGNAFKDFLNKVPIPNEQIFPMYKEGISAEVIDLRTIRPMDHATIIESVKKTNRLVILEEAWPFGNISTEITYQVQEQAFDFLDAPIIKINTADTPAPYSPVLLKEWLPNSEDVVKAVKKVMYK